MITNSQARINAQASLGAYNNTPPVGYESYISIDDPKNGFHAEIYQKTGTGEYIIAFTGTQDGQDWAANTALGQKQWEDNKTAIINVIDNLPNAASITFTGHSLGGALAQYAAYDYLKLPISSHLPVSLATFNALGGMSGLQQLYPSDFDPSIASQITAAHFFGSSSGRTDLVARLGGGHLGGATYKVELAANLGLGEIHSPWDAFENITIPQHAEPIAYLNISSAQYLAALFAYLGDDGTIDNVEGWVRTAAGALVAIAAAPAQELDQILDALLPGGSVIDWGYLRDTRPLERMMVALTGIGMVGIGNGIQFLSQINEATLKAIHIAKQIVQAAYEIAIESGAASATAIASAYKSFDVLAPQIISDYLASQPANTTPKNSPIFDLTVDQQNYKPDAQNLLGSTSGGQGTLGNGPGYTYTMASQYVNLGGIANVAPSSMATASIRPGNESISNMTEQIHAIRQTWAQNIQLQPQQTGSTASQPSSGHQYVYPTNQPDNRIYGTFRYNQNGDPIGINLVPGQQYRDDAGVLKISGSNTYLQFHRIELKADGSFTIESATYRNTAQDAKSLNQQQTANDPNKTEYTDPLVLDVGNDGILFNAGGVDFDYDADGIAEPIAWTAPTDPLLVIDLNRDGRINNGSELVALTDDSSPLNLLSLDTAAHGGNGDGRLDSHDAAYWQLKLWSDRNQDGYASANELQSLNDLGIASIDLDPAHIQTATIAGNPGVKGVTATYTDGSQRVLWDVPLVATTTPTANVISTQYSEDIDKISSNGQIALKSMSSLGVNLNLDGSGATQAIGSLGDDTLMGSDADDWLIGGAGADVFAAGKGSDVLIIDADDRMADINGGEGIDIVIVADDRSTFLNLAQTSTEVVYGGYGDDIFIGGGADNYFIDGAAGNDLIIGGSADDVLSGADGNDVLYGGKGDDLMRGGRDNDVLFGEDGNDVLDGGLGNDTLSGGQGSDVFIASGGIDHIDGGEGIDLIELRGGLEDYTFSRNFDAALGYEWKIVDRKNLDGSTVAEGQVSDRGGIQYIKGVEKFSFMNGQSPTIMEFATQATLPVHDQIEDTSNGGNVIVIPFATLLENDLSLLRLNKTYQGGYALTIDADAFVSRVKWVGDAQGGTVQISGQNVVFTKTPGYLGPVSFSYRMQDIFGPGLILVNSPVVTDINNSHVQAELSARVVIVPAGDEFTPSDPEFSKQWYLGATNVAEAWKTGYTGEGVKVLVLDPDGQFAVGQQKANLNHPDLIQNKSPDFVDTTYHSAHATAVAGVIGAARNGIGSVGVAYQATLDSIGHSGENLKLFSDSLNAMKNYDVVNNSWGFDNPWNYSGISSGVQLQGVLAKNAIFSAANFGRNGLGTVMVFGAGNDRKKGRDAGLSDLANNPYGITVGALNRIGNIGSGLGINEIFSNRGANILVAAPGSNIVSTSNQLITADGYTIGSSVTETQGTSYAAPIISGIAALMLEANPLLSYRDVQSILAITAKKSLGDGVQANTVWNSNFALSWNGQGMHFSHDYGFGLVDAAAAVRMAESWVPEGDRLAWLNSNIATASQLSDLGQQILTFNITEEIDIEHVMLKLELDHERWSDLIVTLVSPSGTQSKLLDRTGVHLGTTQLSNPAGEVLFDNTLMSTHFRGENSLGTWQLIVEDAVAGAAGGNILAYLDIAGSDSDAVKRYYLTDEYAGGWSLTPVADMPTELNASAMSTAIRIDMSGGASQVNGKQFNLLSPVNRLIGGAGNDTLVGTAGNDMISGGRGHDSIVGGAGSDKLIGGYGDDVLTGGEGDDHLIADTGQDTLIGGGGRDVFEIRFGGGVTTHINDFSLQENDQLVIKSTAPSGSLQVQQSIHSNQLVLTLTSGDVQQLVYMQGVNEYLDARKLRLMFENETSLTSDFIHDGLNYPDGTIWVKEEFEVKRNIPKSIASYAGWVKFNYLDTEPDIDSRLYKVAYYTDGYVRADPGQKIIIKYGSNHWSLLESGVLEAYWTPGIKIENGMIFMPNVIHTVYENYGIITYTLENIHWEEGTSGDDIMRPGSTVRPKEISLDEWEVYLNRLGPRKYNGMGGNDDIQGDDRHEILNGGDGNDTLEGGGGDDTLSGGRGSDVFIFSAGHGNDAIEDLTGEDTLYLDGIDLQSTNTEFSNVHADEFKLTTTLSTGNQSSISFSKRYLIDQFTINGFHLYGMQLNNSSQGPVYLSITDITNGNDLIVQEVFGNSNIHTLAGNDLVYAKINNDLHIDLGEGNDTVFAAAGGNYIHGGSGDDSINVISYNPENLAQDTLIGGDGNDVIYGGNQGAVIYGDDVNMQTSGNDSIFGGSANDVIYGGLGRDALYGNEGSDVLHGGDGEDILIGGVGSDILYGEGDDDILTGGSGDDQLWGGAGNDTLSGDDGDDLIFGGDGNDMLIGGKGDDTLEGGAGNDLIISGSGHDVIRLGSIQGNDTIVGVSATDVIEIDDVFISFEILDSGRSLLISSATGTVTIQDYSLGTTIKKGNLQGIIIRDFFDLSNVEPDGRFDFLFAYDLQLEGDLSQSGSMIGGRGDDALYGGPETEDDSAYWYVVGREGNDSLAGSKAGSIIDGGAGEDSILARNNTIIVKNTRLENNVADTLVMPEGITPDQLVFSRVRNPFAWSYWNYGVQQYYEGYSNLTSFEQALSLMNLPDLSAFYTMDSSSAFFPDYWDFSGSFDTLRIQTVDGRFYTDIAGYYSEGSFKNNIDNVVFMTAFDDEGNSLNIGLKDLVENQSIRSVSGLGMLEMDIVNSYSGGGARQNLLKNKFLKSESQLKIVVDSEKSSSIYGKVNFQVGTLDQVFDSNFTSNIYEVDSKNYYLYSHLSQFSSSRDYTYAFNDIYTNTQEYRYVRYAPGQVDSSYRADALFRGRHFDHDPDESLHLISVSQADVIFGFGGDDFIEAGGVFHEVHEVGTNSFFRDYNISFGADYVNGGDGDDSYIYRRNDGRLRIIAIDDNRARYGASGIDTLYLQDYRREEVEFTFNHDGSGTIIGKAQSPDSHRQSLLDITIDHGFEGDLQVDVIVFYDQVFDVRQHVDDLMQAPTEFFSNDGRSYGLNKLADMPLNYLRTQPLRTSYFESYNAVSGSPLADLIYLKDESYTHGYEGPDRYILNNDINFTLVQLDRGDFFSFYEDMIYSQEPNMYSIFHGENALSIYDNKTEDQWNELGVLPGNSLLAQENLDAQDYSNFLYRIFDINYYDASINRFEFGYYDPTINSGITFDNWKPISDDNDIGTDILYTWNSVENGVSKQHSVVFLDALTEWGLGYRGEEVPGLGTQGDDYIVNIDEYGSPLSLDYLAGLGGNDILYTYADDYSYEDNGYLVHIGSNDTILGGSGNDLIDGGAGDDSLYGGNDNDTIYGGYGNDLLDGGNGIDSLIGGQGDDIYIIDNVQDIVIENSNEGIDEIRSYIDIDLRDYSHIENITLLGNEKINATGNDDDNRLKGNGAGGILRGLDGDDVYFIENASDIVVEDFDGGLDTIESTVNIEQLADNVENLYSKGMGLVLFGNRLSNTIVGDDGDNLLNGRGGGDTLIGGVGNDQYVVYGSKDVVRELDGEGHDIIWVKAEYVLADDVSIEELRADTGIGASITGNNLDNLIVGGYGEDTLAGGAGIDTLYGGLNNDTYILNDMFDVIIEYENEGIDTVEIQFNNSISTATEIFLGQGNYQHIENITITGTGLFNITGDAADNILQGNASANTLIAGLGSDTLIGGQGNDRYITGGASHNPSEDVIIEDDGGNNDIDTLVLSVNAQSTPEYQGNLAMVRELVRTEDDLVIHTSSTDPSVEGPYDGSSYDSVRIKNYFKDDRYKVEQIVFADGITVLTEDLIAEKGYFYLGSTANDSMVAAESAIKISGQAGNDTIQGNSKNNILEGGIGHDRLFGLLGDDLIHGDAGDDYLNGGAGNDTLYGGSGNDTYEFGKGYGVDRAIDDNTGDTSTIFLSNISSTDNSIRFEQTSSGSASLVDDGPRNLKVSFTDSADQLIFDQWWGDASTDVNRLIQFSDNVIMTLSEVEQRLFVAAGTSGNDTILGSARHDLISGGNGNDRILGGSGNDTLNGEAGNDFLYGGQGNDVLYGGIGNDQLYGNEGNDTLYGGDGNDTLNGGEGADLMDGGAGFNTFYVDHQGDQVIGNGLIYSRLDQYQLGASNLNEVTVIANIGGGNVIGNSHDNRINGNTDANLLQGNAGNDSLTGNGGHDVLQGGAGQDFLSQGSSWLNANIVLDGGAGDDILISNSTHDFFAGGEGSDQLWLSRIETDIDGSEFATISGQDVIAFNSGDGHDTILDIDGAQATLSLGSIDYSNLRLSKSSNDLKLQVDSNSSITFKDWYNSNNHRSVATLQVIAESMAAFNANGTNVLLDDKVETFDFQQLVNSFDAARNANSNLVDWALTNALLDAHLGGSDTEIIGGDLAYHYGMNGDLTGVGFEAAKHVLSQAGFGQTAQQFNQQNWQSEPVKLA